MDIEKLKEIEKKDYEKAWVESEKLVDKEGKNLEFRYKKGNSHPVADLIEKMRKAFINLGFDEIINPVIVDEIDVYKQYGPEAPLILDRCFYLAGLPRPDLGISKEKLKKIKVIADVNMESLKNIFREYKEAKIEADDLVEEMVKRLNLKMDQATAILNLFEELKELKPIPSKLILRSHMTSAWFKTVAGLLKEKAVPFKLFSIGLKFRREQKLDATHLYDSNVASSVVVADKLSMEDAFEIAKKITKEFGFKDFEIRIKKATSKYYIPNTEFEIFVKSKNGDIEIGDGGFYNPIALSEYGIDKMVFNIGFGVERIAMLLKGESDIRKLTYPQFYTKIIFDDKTIAKMIRISEMPESEEFKNLAHEIKKIIIKHKDDIGPKKILVYEGKGIKAYISEPEEGKKMLGPAGLNAVYVYNANIYGIKEDDLKFKEIVENGIRVCDYLDAISNFFASKIEKNEKGRFTVKIADTLPSINLKIDRNAEEYIMSKRNRIDIRGPIFIDLEVE